MRALIACGAVTVGFMLACKAGRPDEPELWAPQYTVVSDPCGIAVHGYQAAFVVDEDDDGAAGEAWDLYSDHDIVRDDVDGDASADGWTCVIGGGFECVPHRIGRSGGGDVIGWFEGDIANDHELSGTLDVTWGACVAELDVWITKVPWRRDGEAIVPDDDACAEYGDAGDPGQGEADDQVMVVYPASPHATLHQNGVQVGEGAYEAWLMVAGPGDVVVVRDEQGACIDAWQVEHVEQVLVVGGPE